MQKLTYRITTQSPVLIAESSGDTNMVAAADHISGSAVYGCLANRYIQKYSLGNTAHTDNTFYRWFLKGGICFSTAYIVSKNKHGEIYPNYPIPLSVHKLKKEEKEIFDLLFAVDDLDKQTNSIAGFGRLQGESLYQQAVKKSLNFHHQRDLETGVVREGMIFNYESIDAEQIFEGSIYGSDEDLREFVSMFGNKYTIHLGRSRNAQYGMARLEIVPENPAKIQKIALHSGDVSLTLLSNAVIYNENGFSTTDISILQKGLGDGIAIKRAFIKTGDVEGFVSIWKLRRPSERCLLAGSCFLLGVDEGARGRLEELQREGIGERRAEGFGRIAIGMQQHNKLTLREVEDGKPQTPLSQLPELAKEIAVTIAKDFIKKQVELEGLRKVTDFSNLPSKSLVSRLEAMVKNNDAMQLDGLRKTAKDQLENCHNRDNTYTLYDFLTNAQTQGLLNEIMTKYRQQDITKLCRQTGFSPEADLNFQKEAFRLYFLAFFSAMRKEIKNKEGGKQ